MAAKILGNRRGRAGIGIQQLPMSNVNWVAASGQANDVAFVGCSGFNNHPTHLGYAVQGDGKVTGKVEFTLANEALALNPDPETQKNVPWGNAITITTAKDIQPLVAATVALGFTAAKVTFTTPGTIYIFGR